MLLMPNGMGTLSLKWIAHCHCSDSTMLNYNRQAAHNLNTSVPAISQQSISCMRQLVGQHGWLLTAKVMYILTISPRYWYAPSDVNFALPILELV